MRKFDADEACAALWHEYDEGVSFNNLTGLYETVKNNENFYIGRQWEGVEASGLPTPVINVLKRIVSHIVASLVSDAVKLNASPLPSSEGEAPDFIPELLNGEFNALFERNKLGNLIRAYVRSACVDGDGCLYTWYDPDARTGGLRRGAIVTELVDNTRVIFGNPNDPRVERQSHIIIARRESIAEVRRRAKQLGADPEEIKPDSDDAQSWHDALTDDKCTVLLRFRREPETGRIHAAECARGTMLRPEWDTGLTLYPITWFSVDTVKNCYHGQAVVTGLIDNQIFINKMLAGAMLSLMTTAYPKVLYDKTRIAKWDNRIGAAIPMQGGDVATAARIMDPAHISPQVSQFIQLVIDMTKSMCGATEAALGEARAYNTSALLTQQRASSVPHELTRRNLYETIEDLGRIYIDHMAAYYGKRTVTPAEGRKAVSFDFARLREFPLNLKLDVGASSYWSELASLSTLDNLLQSGKIGIVQYLERVPAEYIPRKQELLDELREAEKASDGGGGAGAGLLAKLAGGASPMPAIAGAGCLCPRCREYRVN